MITIQSGKLLIPEHERFVGFAGDNSVNTKQFLFKNRAAENCTYTLCLRFDDDSVTTVELDDELDGSDTILTWRVAREHILGTGIVMAQIKFADGDGNVSHTTRDYFMVGSSVELDDDGAELEKVTRAQLEVSIDRVMQTVAAAAPCVGEDGYWYIYDPDTQQHKKSAYHVSGLTVDDSMSGESANPVSNRVIKQFVDAVAHDCNVYASAYTDAAVSDKVRNSLTIAGISLKENISAKALVDNLCQRIFATLVVPGTTRGYVGQYGLSHLDEPVVCIMGNDWVKLATSEQLQTQMSLVYSKSDIDEMLGDIESALQDL